MHCCCVLIRIRTLPLTRLSCFTSEITTQYIGLPPGRYTAPISAARTHRRAGRNIKSGSHLPFYHFIYCVVISDVKQERLANDKVRKHATAVHV